MRPFRFSIGLLLALLLLLGAVQAMGCQSLSVAEEPPRSTPEQPLWSDEALREHLRFFNGPDVEGRATGTSGYAMAASYVAARMAEFELQPVLAGTAQIVYPTPINEIRASLFTFADAESDTLFYPGVDFLPDGRSDSGRVEIHTLMMGPGSPAEAATALQQPGTALLIPTHAATTDSLAALRRAGAQAVLVVGALAPRPAPRPVYGLMVMQILPETAMRLMRTSRTNLMAQLSRDTRVARRLQRSVRLRVETQALPVTGALNVLSYAPGKHPARARELVIVCTDLDAVGTFAGVPTLDAAHLGTGTAAMLEVARQYAYFARFATVPERTLLFVVFSGAQLGDAGLRAYLNQPLWALDQTKAVVYVGLDSAHEPAVRDLLASYDLPLFAVAPPPDTLAAAGLFLLPDRRPPRRRTIRSRDEEPFRDDPPRLSDLIDAGVVSARLMAEATHALLLREAVEGPLVPVAVDSLRIPDAKQ